MIKNNRPNKENKEEKKTREGRPVRESRFSRESRDSRPARRGTRPAGKKPTMQKPKEPHPEGAMRLNKYIAHAGICSRREADEPTNSSPPAA